MKVLITGGTNGIDNLFQWRSVEASYANLAIPQHTMFSATSLD